MKNHIKGIVRKRQGLCHIRTDDVNFIILPLCDIFLICKLVLRNIYNRDTGPMRRKDRTLLPAAACKTKHICSRKLWKPFPRNLFYTCKCNVKRTVFRRDIFFMTDCRGLVRKTFVDIIPDTCVKTYVIHIFHRNSPHIS